MTETHAPLNVVEELERLRTEGVICAWEMESTTGETAEITVYRMHEGISQKGWYASESRSCRPEAFPEMLRDLLKQVEEKS